METNRAKAVELLAAARTGDLEQVRILLPSCGELPAADDLVAAAAGGMTPLMAAAAGGHELIVELLLRRGADPARRDPRGRSAAFHARAAGHPHLAARLDTVVDQEKTIW